MWFNWIFSKPPLRFQQCSKTPAKTTRKNTRAKGRTGELQARKYLIKHGYKIITVNFYINGGEIDIIARENNTLVFVEVKTSTSRDFANPETWIPHWKQNRIVRASAIYLKMRNITDTAMRYDAITIDADGEINHIKDAFRPSSRFFM